MACIQTELPSVQWLIPTQIPQDSLTIVAINASSSKAWLKNYAGERGISYPLVFDAQGKMYKDYEVGAAYGNTPPTFIIIDPQGVIRYRIDDQFGRALEMKEEIKRWLVK
jgi:peroxiredoxin